MNFRSFRKKLTALSDDYWFFQVALKSFDTSVAGKNPTDLVTNHIKAGFKSTRFPERIAEALQNRKARQEAFRRSAVVMAVAFLDAYLEEAAILHIGGLGFATEAYKLNSIGNAMAQPIVKSSTIPGMLYYMEELVGVNLRAEITQFKRVFKVRCAVAHNGGVVTSQLLRQIPDLKKTPVGKAIPFSWEELHMCLKNVDDIASKIDQKIAIERLRLLELEWHLLTLKAAKQLPLRQKLWGYVDGCQFPPTPAAERRRLESLLYNVKTREPKISSAQRRGAKTP